MKQWRYIALAICLLPLLYFQHSRPATTALVGGTLIDVSNFGHSRNDVKDSVVLFRGEKIVAAGDRRLVSIPRGSRVIKIRDSYVVPGLVDGFGALDNQTYANAYLYMGVTSLCAIADQQRHRPFREASPGPTLYPYGLVGGLETSTDEMLKEIDECAAHGTKCIVLLYKVKPEQISPLVQRIHDLRMVALGELGYTSYREGLKSRIDAFIHFSRYSLELVPPAMRRDVAENPWGHAQFICEEWLSKLDPGDPSVQDYARALGSGSQALMPTLILRCNDLEGMENPWKERVAAILNPADIGSPVSPETGRHRLPEKRMTHNLNFASTMLKIEGKYRAAGAKYLAGSATDVNGTMPGISLHQELELLTRIGMSNREALAAATGNYRRVFRWSELGEISPGSRADIVVVGKDPLATIGNLKEIRMVILKGEILDRQELLKVPGSTTKTPEYHHNPTQ